MFNVLRLKPIEFRSNPALPDDFVVELSTNDYGSPVNKIVLKPQDNKGFMAGAVFDPALMSLRAQLNSGMDLQRVSFGVLENDPNKLNYYARKFEQSLYERHQEFIEKQSSTLSETGDSSKQSPSNS